MKELEKLIEKAYKNGKTINIEELFDLNLTKEEFETVSNLLESKGIKIEVYEEENFDKVSYNNDSLGTYFLEIRKYPLLKPEEEKELIKLYKNGSEEAKEKLICSNLRFVIYIAKSYKVFNEYTGVEMLDLIQYGNIGLIKAIESFDLEKNSKLSTHAYWYIKNEIQKSLYNYESTIRIPIHAKEMLNKIDRFKKEFEVEFGKEPNISDYVNKFNCNEKTINNLLLMAKKPQSLDLDMSSDGDGSLLLVDTIKDVDSEKVFNSVFYKEIFEEAKDMLSERELKILLARNGIDETGQFVSQALTLKEAGDKLGISRERARQIQARAIKKTKKLELNF